MTEIFNSKIYKVSHPESNKCYIGSTQQENLNDRLLQHKNRYKHFLCGKGQRYSVFDVILNDKTMIECIENVAAKNKKELLNREKYHIKKNKDSVVNKYIPNRNIKEYYQDNVKKYKDYYINNKTKLLNYQNEYNKVARLNKCLNQLKIDSNQ